MITLAKARQDYQDAIAILSQIATAPEASSSERNAAREAAQLLTVNFLTAIETEITALTAQYQEFITSLNGLIARLSVGTTPVGALNQLTSLVNTGAQLLGAAKGLGNIT
jgi:hypothetical protein